MYIYIYYTHIILYHNVYVDIYCTYIYILYVIIHISSMVVFLIFQQLSAGGPRTPLRGLVSSGRPAPQSGKRKVILPAKIGTEPRTYVDFILGFNGSKPREMNIHLQATLEFTSHQQCGFPIHDSLKQMWLVAFDMLLGPLNPSIFCVPFVCDVC